MITKVILHNFKQFRNQTFELHLNDLTLFVGGNNSGKSTLLEALSIWEYSKNILIYVKGVNSVLTGGHCDGYGVTLDEFTPVNIPSFKYLWTNLKFHVGKQENLIKIYDENGDFVGGYSSNSGFHKFSTPKENSVGIFFSKLYHDTYLEYSNQIKNKTTVSGDFTAASQLDYCI